MVLPLVESVIWTLVVVLVVIILILVIYLKILRRNIRIVAQKKIKYTESIEGALVQYLYLEETDENYIKEKKALIKKFKKGIINKRKRKIITETFFKLNEQVSGKMIQITHNLFEEIGLLKYAVKKLRSKRWNIIALGIRDLNQFKVERTKHLVKKFVNHSRQEVRREAHLYFLELFEVKGLDFLDTLKVPLSEWDQIQLLGEIEKFESPELLEVGKWLYSKNDYVIIFILRIVKIFNKLENKERLLELLQHNNLEVRLKAIEVVTHFEIREAADILIANYEELTIKEKVQFFTLLEKVATKEDSVFVLNHIYSDDFEIKHKSLHILKIIDKSIYSRLEKTSEDESYNRIINYLDINYGI
jgi:hypothetical protein